MTKTRVRFGHWHFGFGAYLFFGACDLEFHLVDRSAFYSDVRRVSVIEFWNWCLFVI